MDSFVERYKKTKGEFSDFVKEADMQGKAEAVVAGLQPKESKLLAKTLGVAHEGLVDCLVQKMKMVSVLLAGLKEKHGLDLQHAFSSGYSTNYDLELKEFPKGTEDISLAVTDIVRKDHDPGDLNLQFKRIIFPGMKEFGRDLPQDVVKYVYDQDKENLFDTTLWLGDHHYNNGRKWLEEAITGTLRHDLLGWPLTMSMYCTAETHFLWQTTKRHENLNKLLQWFIHLDANMSRLEYRMDIEK